MRHNGPQVLQTCTVCGQQVPTNTTIQTIAHSGLEPQPFIIAPIVMHCGDGGHMVLHPAPTQELMGIGEDE